jgi:phosphoglycolate phosphatase
VAQTTLHTTLLVFDIDGTLVQTKAGRTAFDLAFEQVYGLKGAAGGVKMAGRTDPAIHRELCEAHGFDPATFGAWKLQFLAVLADALLIDPGHALPGVIPLLEACRDVEGMVLALGTGNVEEGARLKLAAHDLNRFFATGGFGGDGETRAEVIARGIGRAEQIHGRAFDRTFVIGDTPADIACGKARGCVTVGVATGPFTAADLRETAADFVLPNFTDLAATLGVLRGLS